MNGRMVLFALSPSDQGEGGGEEEEEGKKRKGKGKVSGHSRSLPEYGAFSLENPFPGLTRKGHIISRKKKRKMMRLRAILYHRITNIQITKWHACITVRSKR